MKAIYKKDSLSRFLDLKYKALNEGKEIEYIELTKSELTEIYTMLGKYADLPNEGTLYGVRFIVVDSNK